MRRRTKGKAVASLEDAFSEDEGDFGLEDECMSGLRLGHAAQDYFVSSLRSSVNDTPKAKLSGLVRRSATFSDAATGGFGQTARWEAEARRRTRSNSVGPRFRNASPTSSNGWATQRGARTSSQDEDRRPAVWGFGGKREAATRLAPRPRSVRSQGETA